MKIYLKPLFVSLLFATLLIACKVEITVPDSGYVTTESGNYSCQPGESCVIDVQGPDFDEVFIATGNEGYFFRNWAERKNSLCGNLVVAECALKTKGFATNDLLMDILGSDQSFYLEPHFSLGECEDRSDEWTEVIDNQEVGFRSQATACPDSYAQLHPHGVLRLWRDEVLISESHWLVGRQQGLETEWWPNGNLKFKLNWKYGGKTGTHTHYYEDGSLRMSEQFQNGTWHGQIRNYSRDGTLTQLQTLRENVLHGPEKYFHDNGQLKLSRQYKLGVRQGAEKTYYRDGTLQQIQTFTNDKLSGRYKSYDESGRLLEEGSYPLLQSKANGTVKDFNLEVFWLQDANLVNTLCARGDPLVVDFIPVDTEGTEALCADQGKMTWNDANEWVHWLNSKKFKGFDDWRLPKTETNPSCMSLCINSDLTQLYHMTLDNPSPYYSDCRPCLINTGPFRNVQRDIYWSGTLHPVWEDAFFVSFSSGHTSSDNFENKFHVWPVRSW